MLFEKDKGFYKQLATIVIPITIQNIISVGINMLDIVMLGKVGQEVLSAASLANQPFFLITLLISGLASGGSILTSQYWGKSDVQTINRVLGFVLRVGILVSAAASLFCIIFPQAIMRVYTNDPAVIKLGADYLRIIAFSYVLSSVTMLYLGLLRSIENVRISMLISLCTLIANGILGYILIFGKLGLPALGIKGAAIATLIARIVEILAVIWYSTFKEQILKLNIKNLFYQNKQLGKDFLKYSLPVVMNEVFWAIGVSMQKAILGHLGTDAVAASSVISVITNLATVATFGLANASAVIIGKALGAGELESAKRRANTLILLSTVFGAFSGALVWLTRPITGLLVELSPSADKLFEQMLIISACNIVFMAFNCTNIIGILRGGGDSKFGMYCDLGFLWFTSFVLGLTFAYVFKAPIAIVYLVMLLDEPLKILPGFLRFKSGKWVKNVTRNLNR